MEREEGKIALVLSFRFDSAHFLPFVPEGHKCRRLHGHTYHLRVGIGGEIDPSLGWIEDFAKIRKKVKEVLKKVDHTLLNAVPGLENPTVENISKWLYKEIKKVLPSLLYVEVEETPGAFCRYPYE